MVLSEKTSELTEKTGAEQNQKLTHFLHNK